MIIVKLIVLFCYVNGFSATPTDFCEICLNHTLCKYKVEGASPACLYYDSSAKLTSQNIKELVNRINERRNFVAMGYSKILPHAANMKKIYWSAELATFAQRWADQCDPTIQPDKEDQCRDLENVKVGQNIASVMGPSPGLSVKGFVEMWFIQVLDYEGSVTYYNKSRDYTTNYLTQLLWANTEFVGCGKVKFYVDETNIMLERLVCNFAPKGNSHGKPVYSIGYPATQCNNGMASDDQYKGLCRYEDDAIYTKLTSEDRPVNSLLRILNLSNDLVKLEIDPIRNNLKQSYVNNNSSKEHRNQKTRHTFTNKTYGAVRRIPQLRKQMMGNSFINMSGNNNDYHFQNERVHSHLYHGHEHRRRNYDTTKIINSNQDFRRYDYTTEPMNSYTNTNFRRLNQYGQCTRRMRPNQENCNQCTTMALDCCPQITMCPFTCTEMSCTQPVEEHTCFTPYIPPLPDPCACTTPTCPPISTNCNYNTNCCSITCSTNTCCHTTLCPGQRSQNNDFNDFRRAGTFQEYDMIPNVVVRSGDQKIPQENASQKGISFVINPDNKYYKSMYDEKDYDLIHKGVTDPRKYKSQERDFKYRSFNSDLRKKRQFEDQMSVKPFWQIENFNHQKPPQLKSLRFTTLKNVKNKVSAIWLTTTEPITLKLADYADYQPEHITDKYLSFDELMHLRKISDGFARYDSWRRKNGKKTRKETTKKGKKKNDKNTSKETTKKGNSTKERTSTKKANKPKSTKPTTTTAKTTNAKTTKPTTTTAKTTKPTTITAKTPTAKTATPTTTTAKTTTAKTTTAKTASPKAASNTLTTTEYTANTPFERKKYCTRKLTCTWTAYTSPGDNGGDNGGSSYGPEIGSRTPPGYVDGCTRTSTCTREYMDRNKISAITADPNLNPDEDSSESIPEDEDYCERRSLNVQRRNSETKKPNILLLRYLDLNRNGPILTTDVHSEPDFVSLTTESVTESISNTHDCTCNEKYTRQKREESEWSKVNKDKRDHYRSSYSYRSLYYLILNKILRSKEVNTFHNKQCPCNSSISSNPVMFLFLLMVFNTFYL